jgi:hypothetical protein
VKNYYVKPLTKDRKVIVTNLLAGSYTTGISTPIYNDTPSPTYCEHQYSGSILGFLEWLFDFIFGK